MSDVFRTGLSELLFELQGQKSQVQEVLTRREAAAHSRCLCSAKACAPDLNRGHGQFRRPVRSDLVAPAGLLVHRSQRGLRCLSCGFVAQKSVGLWVTSGRRAQSRSRDRLIKSAKSFSLQEAKGSWVGGKFCCPGQVPPARHREHRAGLVVPHPGIPTQTP